MPPLERTDLNDYAVVWPLLSRGGYDGYPSQMPADGYAEPMCGLPFQIKVRWVGRQTRVLDREGNTIALDATMVMMPKSRIIPVGSIVFHGQLEDMAGTGSFSAPEHELYQIKMISDTPDIKNRHHRRTAGLMRFRSSLPTIVNIEAPPDE